MRGWGVVKGGRYTEGAEGGGRKKRLTMVPYLGDRRRPPSPRYSCGL